MGSSDVALEASVEKHPKKRSRKKRGALDASVTDNIAYVVGEGARETRVEDNEPTMADKLTSLDAAVNDNADIDARQDLPQTALPSADSVHVLLKQALHADDRALLLDCLYNQDDKVIANSVMRLNPTDVFKLLDSLISMIQSRGAVLACAVPWLRSLLVVHLSRIMSQESSLVSLNSLSELIESRIGTLSPALQLASSLDFLCSGVEDDGLDDYESAAPVIFEDNDESEEEEESRDDVMDTNEDNNELEEPSGISGVDELEDLTN